MLRVYITFICVLASALAAGLTSPIASTFSPFDSQDFCSQIITPTCNTTFSYIDALNAQIRPQLSELVKTPYFRYFKLDFDKQCKFWNAQHFCATRNCAVEILPPDQYNWSNIEEFSPSKLGEIQRPEPESDEAGTCEDLDYCHIDDGNNCVYVDLVENPERFTGYGGNQSMDVWKAIYSENCFPNTNPMSMSSTNSEPEQCVEKNLFYRLISGLHASIGVHLSNEYLCPDANDDVDDGRHEQVFEPNLRVFMERVGSFNDRLSNIYFNYALISQAIIKLSDIFDGGLVDQITCGDQEQQAQQQQQQDLQRFLGNEEPDYKQVFGSILPALSSHTLFNTTSLFDPQFVSPELKNEFRQRFRNVSAIMDCVGCDRCRMWGKLQTIGYGTALKVLFEDEKKGLKFRRIELVALFNTFDRISKSVEAINNFKQMYLQHLEDVQAGKAQLGEYEKDRSTIKGFSFPFMAEEPVKKLQSSKKNEESKIKAASAAAAAAAEAEKKQDDKIESKTAESTNKKRKRKFIGDKQVRRTFNDEFSQAFDEVKEATIFVLTSYKTLIPTVWQYSLIKLNNMWESFIGKPNPYQEYMDELNSQREGEKSNKEGASEEDDEEYKKIFV